MFSFLGQHLISHFNLTIYFFRSTPCPNVKSGDEWGDPVSCEAGDGCQYCHTRTEQQFHPEIYKSTKCNDIQNTSYCPRGAFCAFAHVERKNFLIFTLFFCKICLHKKLLFCPIPSSFFISMTYYNWKLLRILYSLLVSR